MVILRYKVTRENGKYTIHNEHYLSASPLLREIAETMVYLQENFSAAFDIHLGHLENILLADSMKAIREKNIPRAMPKVPQGEPVSG